jgi:hypothetical protein
LPPRVEERYPIVSPIIRHVPDAALRDDASGDPLPRGLVSVSTKSAPTLRRAVWKVSTYAQRELELDFPVYGDSGRDTDEEARAYLWVRSVPHDAAVLGACCFRHIPFEDVPDRMSMTWVWLHPYVRRQGLLRAAWPYLRQRFGDFYLDPPLSPAMRAFVTSLPDGLRPDWLNWSKP